MPQDVDASFLSELGELSDVTGQVHQLISHAQPPFGLTQSEPTSVVTSPDEAEITFGGVQDHPNMMHPGLSAHIPDHLITKERSGTLPQSVTRPLINADKRSNSYDDRPLQSYFGNDQGPPVLGNISSSLTNGGLGIPGRATTREERRRSMNPPPRQPSRAEMRSSPETPNGHAPSSDSEFSTHPSPNSTFGDRSTPSASTSYTSQSSHNPSGQSNSQQHDAPPKSGPDSTTSNSTSSAFPPRGKSLRIIPSKSNKTNVPIPPPIPIKSPSTRIPAPGPGEESVPHSSRSRSTPSPSPSFSIEPASDDDNDADDSATLPLSAPRPPPKGDHDRDLDGDSPPYSTTSDPSSHSITPTIVPSLSMTPPSAATLSLEEERTPVQVRRGAPTPSGLVTGAPQLEAPAPALPPIRLSLHTTDFGDLLKSVAGSPPRVPLSRESFLRISTGWQTIDANGNPTVEEDGVDDEDHAPLSPSDAAQERIKAYQGSSKHLLDTTGNEASSSAPPTAALAAPSAQTRLRSGSASGGPTSAPPTSLEHHGSNRENDRGRERDRDKERLLGPNYTAMNGSSPNLTLSLSSTSTPARPAPARTPSVDLAGRRLREALTDAQARGASTVKLDPALVEAVLRSMDGSNEAQNNLKEELELTKVTIS